MPALGADTASEAALHKAAGVIDVTVVSTAVSAIDRHGQAVLDLRPDELSVTEDGRPVEVLGLAHGLGSDVAAEAPGPGTADTAPAPPRGPVTTARPWRVVAYIGTELAGRFVLPQLCRSMADQADTLTGLGPVDVVLANPSPRFVIRSSREAGDVRAAIETIASDASGMTTVEQIRRGFTAEFKPGVGFNQSYTITQSAPETFAARARACVHRERTVIRGELDRMVAWIQDQPPTERGVLMWMTGGFDLNPADFYLPLLDQIDPFLAQSLRSDYPNLGLQDDVTTLVEVALTYGWVVLPISLSSPTFSYGADVGGTGKSQHHLGVGGASIDAQGSDFRQVAPNYPLQVLAAATGGELVINDHQLRDALGHARNAYQLAYQVERPADGLLHKVKIETSRPGVRILNRSYVAAGSLRGVATARARRLLGGEAVAGGLTMGAVLGNITQASRNEQIGELQIRAVIGDLRASLEPIGLGRMRVTVVVDTGEDSPFVHHQEVEVDWSSLDNGTWLYDVALKWPRSAHHVAVMVEELVTATWGGTVLDLE